MIIIKESVEMVVKKKIQFNNRPVNKKLGAKLVFSPPPPPPSLPLPPPHSLHYASSLYSARSN